MSEIEFLNWVRGPGFQIAIIIFVAGVIIRFAEILLLGRKPNLAEAKGSEMSGGLHTIVSRSFPDKNTFQRSMFTVVAGYIFHIGGILSKIVRGTQYFCIDKNNYLILLYPMM